MRLERGRGDTGVGYGRGSDFSKERLQQLKSSLCLDTSNLSDDQAQQVMGLATEFADVFALGPSEMGSTDLVTHCIDTGDSPPIKQPARRIPFALQGRRWSRRWWNREW